MASSLELSNMSRLRTIIPPCHPSRQRSRRIVLGQLNNTAPIIKHTPSNCNVIGYDHVIILIRPSDFYFHLIPNLRIIVVISLSSTRKCNWHRLLNRRIDQGFPFVKKTKWLWLIFIRIFMTDLWKKCPLVVGDNIIFGDTFGNIIFNRPQYLISNCYSLSSVFQVSEGSFRGSVCKINKKNWKVVDFVEES